MMAIRENLLIRVFFILAGYFVLLWHGDHSLLYAQAFVDNEKLNPRWLSAGIGVGSQGLALGAGFTYQMRKSALLLRYRMTQELGDFIFHTSDEPKKQDWDVGILYGIHWKSEKSVVTILAGLSLVGGVRRGKLLRQEGGLFSYDEYERLTYRTIGFPIELHLTTPPFKQLGIGESGLQLGIGISGFANLNSQDTFGGALVSLLIGKIRKTDEDDNNGDNSIPIN